MVRETRTYRIETPRLETTGAFCLSDAALELPLPENPSRAYVFTELEHKAARVDGLEHIEVQLISPKALSAD